MTPPRSLHLAKLHATGNDFLVHVDLDERWGPRGSELLDRATRAALCDRATGIGADGLIRILPASSSGASTPSTPRVAMELANADGGWAEMSGNGIRCLAWVAAREGIAMNDTLAVDTLAGERMVELERSPSAGGVVGARVEMGSVTFDPSAIPVDAPSAFELEATVHGTRYVGDAAGMGNPHFVLFVDDPAEALVDRHGRLLERDGRFPNRTNVEFVAQSLDDSGRLRMRVWERGIGETRSCGTGACAVAAVAHRRGMVGEQVTIAVPGGELEVELGPGPEGAIRLGGPVRHVFDVEIDLDKIRDGASIGGRA